MKRVGRVIAQTLQGENIVNQVLAVDSYAKQRGFHIAWDTEATAVLTLTDGALRLWFDEGRMSGIEEAKPQVGPEVLAKCLSQAAEHRAALAQARESLEKVAAAEAQQQNAEREQQAAQKAAARAEAERAEQQERAEAERAAERAKVEREQAERAEREKMAAQKAEREAAQKAKAEREKAEREQAKAEREKVTGVSTTEHLYPDTEAPFDQDPREDSEHGTVTTSTLPAGAYRDGEAEDAYEAETVDLQVHEDEVHTGVTEVVEVQEEHTEISIDEELIHAPEEELEHPEQEPEELPEPLEPEHAEPEHVEPEHHEPEHPEPVQQEHKTDEEGKKKGFFSRFFGL
jgi:predicted hydrolase